MAGAMSVAEILKMQKAAAAAGTSSGISGRPPKPTSAPSTPASVVQDPEVNPEKQKKKKRKTSPSKSPVRVSRRGSRPGPDLFTEDLDVKAILDTFVTEGDRSHLRSLDKSELAVCSVRSLIQNAASVAHLGDHFLELQEELKDTKEEAVKLHEELRETKEVAARVEQAEEELKKAREAQKAFEAKARQKLKLSEEKRKTLEKEHEQVQSSLGALQEQHDRLLMGAVASLEELYANLKAQAEVLAPGVDFSRMVIDGRVEGGVIVGSHSDPTPEVQVEVAEEEARGQEEPAPAGGDS